MSKRKKQSCWKSWISDIVFVFPLILFTSLYFLSWILGEDMEDL